MGTELHPPQFVERFLYSILGGKSLIPELWLVGVIIKKLKVTAQPCSGFQMRNFSISKWRWRGPGSFFKKKLFLPDFLSALPPCLRFRNDWESFLLCLETSKEDGEVLHLLSSWFTNVWSEGVTEMLLLGLDVSLSLNGLAFASLISDPSPFSSTWEWTWGWIWVRGENGAAQRRGSNPDSRPNKGNFLSPYCDSVILKPMDSYLKTAHATFWTVRFSLFFFAAAGWSCLYFAHFSRGIWSGRWSDDLF